MGVGSEIKKMNAAFLVVVAVAAGGGGGGGVVKVVGVEEEEEVEVVNDDVIAAGVKHVDGELEIAVASSDDGVVAKKVDLELLMLVGKKVMVLRNLYLMT